jgi:hypothetical protein
MIKASRHSWWQAKYSDGRILSEWDTILGTNFKSSRWEDVPKKGMIGLRLLCPNGMAGELAAPEGCKFFQLKVGYAFALPGNNRKTGAHLIGVVDNANGNCLCRAWDYETKKLLEFRDNIYNMKYENLGKLSLEVQGLKV